MFNALLQNHAWFVYTFFALLALSVGSLLNVVIYRLPLMLQRQWRQQCCELLHIDDKKVESRLNLFLPRSFCPHCKTQVKFWQNIPVLSYIFLMGSCSECGQKISLRYPFVEILTLALSLYASYYFGFTLALPFALGAIYLLIILLFIDIDHQILPDCLTLGLLWLGLLANTQQVFIALNEAVFSAVLAYLGLWLFVQIFYLITGKIGMGNGDFKLFAAFGAWFGWVLLPIILLLASFFGAAIGICYLKINNKSKDTPIPFGPFLAIAGIVVLFWGNNIVQAYLHFVSLT